MYLDTAAWLISIPSLSSSPWIRGAPQKGLSRNCPFKGAKHQLIRNFLFAAAYAARARKGFFGVLALCPRATSGMIESQLNVFRDEILLPEYRKLVKLAHYEDYIAALYSARDPDAREPGEFLSDRCLAIRGLISSLSLFPDR